MIELINYSFTRVWQASPRKISPVCTEDTQHTTLVKNILQVTIFYFFYSSEAACRGGGKESKEKLKGG